MSKTLLQRTLFPRHAKFPSLAIQYILKYTNYECYMNMPSFCLILIIFDSRASGNSDSGNVCLYFPAQRKPAMGYAT